MSSMPTFGLGSNNAPPPPMGNTNPTGTNSGVSLTGTTFPNYPLFGSPSSSPIPLSSNAPLFGATNFGGAPGIGGGGSSGMSSGFDFGNNWQNFANSLGKTWGKGTGQGLYNILSEGLFNPQTADAFLNAMQPSINQGTQSIMNQFGSTGSRFGSSSALGLSNYLGQANLNEQQTMASMFMQAQQEQLQLLEGLLPTLHAEKANSGGWVHDLVGGLEVAGGIASMFVPGLQGLGGSLIAGGAGQIAQGVGGGGSTPNSTGQFAPMNPMLGSGNTGTFGANAPTWQNAPYSGGQFDEITQWDQSASAASLYGGAEAPQLPSFMYAPQ